MTPAQAHAVPGSHSRPAGPVVVRERLQDGCITERTRVLAEILSSRIIGQEEAVEALTCSFARLLTRLRDPDRPALTLLLLGPTGVGKTETARALAYALFGSEHALTQINCEEYTHGHEVSKLLGAPPGYVGFGLQPLLSPGGSTLPAVPPRTPGTPRRTRPDTAGRVDARPRSGAPPPRRTPTR